MEGTETEGIAGDEGTEIAFFVFCAFKPATREETIKTERIAFLQIFKAFLYVLQTLLKRRNSFFKAIFFFFKF